MSRSAFKHVTCVDLRILNECGVNPQTTPTANMCKFERLKFVGDICQPDKKYSYEVVPEEIDNCVFNQSENANKVRKMDNICK